MRNGNPGGYLDRFFIGLVNTTVVTYIAIKLLLWCIREKRWLTGAAVEDFLEGDDEWIIPMIIERDLKRLSENQTSEQ